MCFILHKTISFMLILVTKIDLESTIKFHTDWEIYNKYLASPDIKVQSATDPAAIKAIENNVRLWMISMERVKFAILHLYSGCIIEIVMTA